MPSPSDAPLHVESASYRDPDSFVFYCEDRVCRAFSRDAWSAVERAWRSGVIEDLIRDGCLVRSEIVPVDSEQHRVLATGRPGWERFVFHERVPVISYPYEWSRAMLADAGLLHLHIQNKLLAAGFSLKDASAFNVQFVGPRPIFIELGSVEVPGRMDVWIAYSQFCRMFLFPLLLFVHRGLGFKESFLGNVDGPSVDQVVKVIGRLRAMRPDMFLDVFLQHALGARGKQQARALRAELQAGSGNAGAQLMNLERLERKLQGLRGKGRASGLWVGYEQDNTYARDGHSEKTAFIRDFMKEHRPGAVLDLGCNTGEYSVLCAQAGARVVAIDSDHDCVELLYGRAQAEKLNILPLVADLVNPSPGLGFMNRERKPLFDRVRSEAVLALALVHHLLITARLPLAAICEMMATLAEKHLIIEFVEREDEMFQTLLALRKDLYEHITLDAFLEAFSTRFELIRKSPIPGSRRHLVHFRRR